MPQPSWEIRVIHEVPKYILKIAYVMRNTLVRKILLLYKIMAIIQTPQVGNQSAYPTILHLSITFSWCYSININLSRIIIITIITYVILQLFVYIYIYNYNYLFIYIYINRSYWALYRMSHCRLRIAHAHCLQFESSLTKNPHEFTRAISCEIMWSCVKFNLWKNFTWNHMWNFTNERISHEITCDISHVKGCHMKSHVTFHMWKDKVIRISFSHEITNYKVKFYMYVKGFHMKL
jgi:hypothetical protein